jgi:hypothetical protein
MHDVVIRQTGYICKDGGETIVRNPAEAVIRLDPTSLDVFTCPYRKVDGWKKVVPDTDRLVMVRGRVMGIFDSDGNVHKSWMYYVGQDMMFCITEFAVPSLERRRRDFEALLDKVVPPEIRYPRANTLEIDGEEYGFERIYRDLSGMKFFMDRIKTDTLLETL